MRHVTQWLVAIGVVTGGVAGTASSSAQPTVRDHRHPTAPPPAAAPPAAPPPAAPPPADHVRDHRREPPPAAGPTEAPPPLRDESMAPRAGFVFVRGRWDWRSGKWEWLPGHWERERAGKRWNPGHWDRQGDRWVYSEGGWADGAPPPPAAGPTEAPPPLRDESMAPRAGFVFVRGRWDWRSGKWEWLPGHWERERAGKRWNPGHWDRQGDRWVYSEGGWADGAPPPPAAPPPADGRPHEPPPPPRAESPAPRAGFVFVRGRWDWRNGTWEWLPGHWERERAGKQWREARWEQHDGGFVLVDGEWIDVGAAAPPPPPPGSPERRERHREWKLDRPMVSSYWPLKGKVGSRIVIHGRNFPVDTVVLWSGMQVSGAKVTPDAITVVVPPGSTSGDLSLRTGGRGRDLAVGSFEVADYDAAAEARRQAEEARQRAEREWAARQKQLARDRAARMAAAEKRRQELAETREQRRADRLREIRARWEAAFLADPDTQAELTLHAQRTAELTRAKEIAELSENGKLVVRIGVAQDREDQRHDARMSALHDAFGRKP